MDLSPSAGDAPAPRTDGAKITSDKAAESSSATSLLFVERICNSQQDSRPDRIQVLVSRVNPKLCSSLIKRLSKRPRNDDDKPTVELSHLRRVRRISCQKQTDQSEASSSQPVQKKQKREEPILEVLLREAPDNRTAAHDADDEWLRSLKGDFDLSIETRSVPGRPASSKKELEEFDKIWPTIYFHEQSDEHQHKLLELSNKEVAAMQRGMEQAIEDSRATALAGAVIVDPATARVVSAASSELKMHRNDEVQPTSNPLSTPVLLAIQGVSRIERDAAIGHGMDSDAFTHGQYLCTGYDLYTTKEPSVFEAMACVHSRIRRVIFGIDSPHDGGLGGTGDATAVHSLPGTNHHYRAFACREGSPLWEACRVIHADILDAKP